jgi:hypothetical protein
MDVHQIHLTLDGYPAGSTPDGTKLYTILNLLPNDSWRPEIITAHTFKGDFAQAKSAMFLASDLYEDAGVKVLRRKIEVLPKHPFSHNAIYCEAHVKVTLSKGNLDRVVHAPIPLSVNRAKLDKMILTFRAPTLDKVRWAMRQAKLKHYQGFDTKVLLRDIPVECALYDSNPKLDADWIP